MTCRVVSVGGPQLPPEAGSRIRTYDEEPPRHQHNAVLPSSTGWTASEAVSGIAPEPAGGGAPPPSTGGGPTKRSTATTWPGANPVHERRGVHCTRSEDCSTV